MSRISIAKPMTFNEVVVFAGIETLPAADASYRNLVWENLPDIVFHAYTPPIVSLSIMNIEIRNEKIGIIKITKQV